MLGSALFARGTVLSGVGRVLEAADAMTRSQALLQDLCSKFERFRPFLQSNDATYTNGLAWLLVTTDDESVQNPARAAELARAAVAVAPNEAGIWNTKGVAEYRVGNFPASLASLEKSMELNSGGAPEDWFFVAMAHWHLRHEEPSRRGYAKAIEWTEQNPTPNMELQRFRAEAAELLGRSVPTADNARAALRKAE